MERSYREDKMLSSLMKFLVIKVNSSITYYTSCAYSNKTKNNRYWMGRGARALENLHTAKGEESLEKLYALLDDLRGGGVRSQAFLSLQSKVERRSRGSQEGKKDSSFVTSGMR
ncbi:hypothetical protein V6N11_034321 [Hibiscus sabdariffa]|uniref:DUF8018 domain-containing protein n=2 Tax=Hibiscus sabdariffa TaxID=183260 RepID=A0ABR1ZYR7_9ROSI